jgi:hypothetical protein
MLRVVADANVLISAALPGRQVPASGSARHPRPLS